MRHTVENLGKSFATRTTQDIASSSGKGSRKSLFIRITHDGYAFMSLEYVVENHGKEEAFTTFDGAVEAYNELP
jgi:CRISPR/Cas system-associated protein Csx1